MSGQLLQIFIGQPLAHFMETKAEAWQEQQAKQQLPVVVVSKDDVVVTAGFEEETQLKNVHVLPKWLSSCHDGETQGNQGRPVVSEFVPHPL